MDETKIRKIAYFSFNQFFVGQISTDVIEDNKILVMKTDFGVLERSKADI